LGDTQVPAVGLVGQVPLESGLCHTLRATNSRSVRRRSGYFAENGKSRLLFCAMAREELDHLGQLPHYWTDMEVDAYPESPNTSRPGPLPGCSAGRDSLRLWPFVGVRPPSPRGSPCPDLACAAFRDRLDERSVVGDGCEHNSSAVELRTPATGEYDPRSRRGERQENSPGIYLPGLERSAMAPPHEGKKTK
jgi:hypothetical protein